MSFGLLEEGRGGGKGGIRWAGMGWHGLCIIVEGLKVELSYRYPLLYVCMKSIL